MNVQSKILCASGKLLSLEKLINEVSKTSISKIIGKIPVDNVDIVFYDNPQNAIEHLGFGGSTITENLIMISIDPQFPNIEQSIEKKLQRTIAHELYHCLRKYSMNKNYIFLEALINEGLADHFEIEITDGKPEQWDTALNTRQLKMLLKKAKGEYDNANYDHYSWFFGSKEKKIPKWSGYTIGFFLISEYLNKNKNKKPSQLYTLDVEDFFKK